MQIRIEHLSKTYPAPFSLFGGRTPVAALSDVTLTIGVGMFGLLGPNGAGKTTLMRILCTLLEPTAGRIQVGDVDRLKDPQGVRRLIGYLPQEFGFFKRLTAREYLEFAASMKGVSPRQIPSLLERVNLAHETRKNVGTYSGGMKRRLGIAQALLGDPQVLVVDEPTAGLDPEERLRFRNLLAELSGERIVLLSTHIVADVESSCSQVAVIDKGRVRFAGSPSLLVQRARGQVWQLQVDDAEYNRLQYQLQVISSRRSEQGITLRVLAPENPLGRSTPAAVTMEDAYLHLMESTRGVPA